MNWSNPLKLLIANIRVMLDEFVIIEILPGKLYQSSTLTKKGIEKARNAGVNFVIDVEGSFDRYDKKLFELYIHWPFTDGRKLPDTRRLISLTDFAAYQLQEKDCICLAHCGRCNNRSGLINASILTALGHCGKDAVKLIQSKRPTALSNNTFRTWIERQQPFFNPVII